MTVNSILKSILGNYFKDLITNLLMQLERFRSKMIENNPFIKKDLAPDVTAPHSHFPLIKVHIFRDSEGHKNDINTK